YDFRLTLPGTPYPQKHPIYLVQLDDESLPEKTSRSPVDKQWLLKILQSVKGQSPRAVGLNLALSHGNTQTDGKLAQLVTEMDNVVLLDAFPSDESRRFQKAAKSWGNMSYRLNSSGDVQYVCDDSRACLCTGAETCGNRRIFYRELLKIMFPERDGFQFPVRDGWLKILFLHTPSEIRSPTGNGPWEIVSAGKLLELEPGSFEPGSLVLIGTDFQGLYPRFRIPLQTLSSQSTIPDDRQVTSLELTALVLEMIFNKAYLQSVPFWLECLVLLICLLPVMGSTGNTFSFLPLWTGIVLALIWNLAAAVLFAYFSLEMGSLVPSLVLTTYGLFCIRHSQVQAKMQKLSLINQLQKERFDGLVDRFHTHSVFNALEHIRFLIRTRHPDAERFLLDYSTLLLDDLRHDPQQEYPLNEQWEYVKHYLRLQNLKQGGKIELEFVVSPDLGKKLEEIRLPWKLFYPLVENAFKYTEPLLRRKTDMAARIGIELDVEGRALSFQVTNSFSGDEKAPGSGQGIQNLKKRLTYLYPKGGWTLQQRREKDFWISKLQVPVLNRHLQENEQNSSYHR
ncbi:MAG: CHASE2 domain-containing protein, partial [Proteobacteria bacterium]|nr:CHASE2 domain-containing protein [Pseudomonadota bacterium]